LIYPLLRGSKLYKNILKNVIITNEMKDCELKSPKRRFVFSSIYTKTLYFIFPLHLLLLVLWLCPIYTAHASVPDLTTGSAYAITKTSATLGGEVTNNYSQPVTERGFQYDLDGSYSSPTAINETSVDFGLGTYTLDVTGLSCGTTYHFRAYAIADEQGYGGDVTFVTTECSPDVTTNSASSISTTEAVLNGTIDEDYGYVISERGFQYNTTGDYGSYNLANETGGGMSEGMFNRSEGSLTSCTTYHFRAYAINNALLTTYGSDTTFDTLCVIPSVTTIYPATNILSTSVTLNGTLDFGDTASQHGFVYGTDITFQTVIATSTLGTKAIPGSANENISSLTCETTYYYRFYAENTGGIDYGSTEFFVTGSCSPTVSTSAASSVTATTTTFNANITSLGASNVTQKGFAYGTSATLTTVIATSTLGTQSSTGTFTENMTGLTCNTTYHVRAYATNDQGTSYGSIQNFTTAGCVSIYSTSVSVTENSNNTYMVVLEKSPSNTVTINLSVTDPSLGPSITLNTYSLSFDNTNWSTPQTITVTATNDNDYTYGTTKNRTATIDSSVSSVDSSYNNASVSDVTVTISDDDLSVFGTGYGASPRGIAIDSSGNIYASYTSGNVIRKFDSAGVYQSSIGSAGTAEGQFSNPMGLAIDGSGNLYVVDQGRDRIQKFDSNGNFLRMFGKGVSTGGSSFEICTSSCQSGSNGSGDGDFTNAWAISIDSSGNLYVVDSSNRRVQKYDSNGNFLLTFGWGVSTGASAFEICTSGCQIGSFGSGDGQLQGPQSITIDHLDRVFAGDPHRIQRFTTSGSFVSVIIANGSGNGQVSGVTGLTHDYLNNLYISEDTNTRIQKITYDGTYIAKWGSSGTATGQVSSPKALIVDNNGDVLVTELGNLRVQKFNFTIRPNATTTSATSVSTTSITFNGNIVNTGDSSVTEHGFAYGTDSALNTVIATTTLGAGSQGTFNQTLSSLTHNTTYYFRAYAVNSSGTTTGNILSTTTVAITAPTLTTGSASSVTTTAGTLSAEITGIGNETVGSRGFVYGTSIAYGATTTENGSYSTGTFTTDITGLTCGTTYHFNSYASNTTAGVGYGIDATFDTSACANNNNNNGGGGGGSSSGGYSLYSWFNSLLNKISTTSITISPQLLNCPKGYNCTPAVTGLPEYLLSKKYILGTSGPFVKSLQEELQKRGYFPKEQTLTNYFGPITSKAYSKYIVDELAGKFNNRGISSNPNNVVSPTAAVINNKKLTKNLFLGNTDPEVKMLQQFLNIRGYTVTVSGPGSPGKETDYFGNATKSALIKFQINNNINPTGNFGPITRELVNSIK
jgi:hypothetical protein